jgi:arylsulfate sulfotransferase
MGSHFKRRKLITIWLTLLALILTSFQLLVPVYVNAASLTVVNAIGPTPFIQNVTVSPIDLNDLDSISFTIQSKSGSLTRPISALFDKAYLVSQGRINNLNNSVTIPVFGLYASQNTHTNLVNIAITFKSKLWQKNMITDRITTTPWSVDPYSSPRKVVPRNSIALSYSFFYLKEMAGDGVSPVVIDTDGEVRWIGTNKCNTQSYKFFRGAFFKNCGNTLVQNNLDGSWGAIADYSTPPVNATWIGHHNYDIGKNGLLLEIDANGKYEQSIIEVDPVTGAVLKTFDFSQIISSAMLAGKDNPKPFVNDPVDWFHNNSATYWPSRNELVVSSRENFVMGIDYSTGTLKWILGDPTKPWHSYKSLLNYSLALPQGTPWPEGQHALSITNNDQLLMFDDDQVGFNGGGGTRATNPPVSAPRIYAINESAKTATQTWEFNHNPSIYSDICSSVYQDGTSFLIDYAALGRVSPSSLGQGPEIVGIDANKNVAFDYFYPGNFTNGWYADPIHLEFLRFIGSSKLYTFTNNLETLSTTGTPFEISPWGW